MQQQQQQQQPKQLQLLFVIDVTERTGSAWSLLYRACLGILEYTQHKQPPPYYGLMAVRSQGVVPLCIPSALMTDVRQLKTSLRDLLFDGGPGPPAHVEALLAAASGSMWHPNATQRHIVFISHGEPGPMPSSLAAQCSRMPAASSLWSPLPELMAAERISLSLIAPRPLPRLVQMHTAVCKAANVDPPAPTRFDASAELLVISPMLPTQLPPSTSVLSTDTALAAVGALEADQKAQQAKRPRTGAWPSLSSSLASSASANSLVDPPSLAPPPQPHQSPDASAAPGQAAGTKRLPRQSSSPPLTQLPSPTQPLPGASRRIWVGKLHVEPKNTQIDLGEAQLSTDNSVEEAARWREVATRTWGDDCLVTIWNGHDCHARLEKMLLRDKESYWSIRNGFKSMPGAVPIRLTVTTPKARELFARLGQQPHALAMIGISTQGHESEVVIIDDFSQIKTDDLTGWIIVQAPLAVTTAAVRAPSPHNATAAPPSMAPPAKTSIRREPRAQYIAAPSASANEAVFEATQVSRPRPRKPEATLAPAPSGEPATAAAGSSTAPSPSGSTKGKIGRENSPAGASPGTRSSSTERASAGNAEVGINAGNALEAVANLAKLSEENYQKLVSNLPSHLQGKFNVARQKFMREPRAEP